MNSIHIISHEEFRQLSENTNMEIRDPLELGISEEVVFVHDVEAKCLIIVPEHDKYYSKFTSRNKPLLSNDQQKLIQKGRVAIAGQGTVGGNAALTFVRYGYEHLKISDGDVYEVSNLNRQVYSLLTLGTKKTSVITQQIGRINPFAHVEIHPEITQHNIDDFFSNIDIAICALDQPEIIVKINQNAKEKRIPLLLGTDLGSRVLLDVFDYREDIPLFNGKLGKYTDNPLKLSDNQLVTKIVGVLNTPPEMLNAAYQKFKGNIDYFPQTIVSAQVCSALLVESATSIILGKPVKSKAIVDVFDATHSFPTRLRRKVEWFQAMRKLLSLLNFSLLT